MTTWSVSYHCLILLIRGEGTGKISTFVLSLSMSALFMLVPAWTCAFHTASGSLSSTGTELKGADRGMSYHLADANNHPIFAISLVPGSQQTFQLNWQTGSAASASHNSMALSSFFLDDGALQADTVPRPSTVMRKSMILPGWGQVVNRQAWKVPIIYGMLAGLTYYSILMDQNYRDYRAAFYNSQNPDGDQRFGPTPPHIDPNQNPESMRYNRNVYRNRRDLTIIGVVLAYGLNIVDAYVFAQMRDFDVSDDLSARFQLGPAPVNSNWDLQSTPHTSMPFRLVGGNGVMLTLQLAFR